jgi:hypothetical protein
MPQALRYWKLHQAPCQPTSVFGVPNVDNYFLGSGTTFRQVYYLPQSRISTLSLPQPRHVTKTDSRQRTPHQPTNDRLPNQTHHPHQSATFLHDLKYTALISP